MIEVHRHDDRRDTAGTDGGPYESEFRRDSDALLEGKRFELSSRLKGTAVPDARRIGCTRG